MSQPTSTPDLSALTRAFEAITGEMRYQAAQPCTNTPSVAGEILLIEEWVAKARTQYTVNDGDEQALCELRKVAATCMRAMINHGAYAREGY